MASACPRKHTITIRAAPGWRTWTRRLCVLQPGTGALVYYDAALPPAAIAAALGAGHPAVSAPDTLPLVTGGVAEGLLRAARLSGEKGDVGLKGAAVGVAVFSDSDAGGTLADMPSFTVTDAAGRVYRFVAASPGEMQVWLDLLAAEAAAADKAGGGVLRAASDRALSAAAGGDAGSGSSATALPMMASTAERAAGWMHKSDPRGGRWKRRFFVLRGTVLSYYTDDTRAEIKGSVDVAPASGGVPKWLVEAGAGPARTPAITHPTPHKVYLGPVGGGGGSGGSDRSFWLSADGEAQVKMWVDALRLSIAGS